MKGLAGVFGDRPNACGVETYKSSGSRPARFNCLSKYSLEATFLTISATWAFHLKSSEMKRPKSLALLTTFEGEMCLS